MPWYICCAAIETTWPFGVAWMVMGWLVDEPDTFGLPEMKVAVKE